MSIYDKSSLVLIPSGTKTGKVFSQKPVSGDGDFTFTRASAATRVNADGNIEKETSNKFIYSNNFNSGWSPKAGTFTQGIADPNGGSNAWSWTAVNTDPYLYQFWNLSGIHCVSIWAKGVGSTIGHDIEIRIGSNTAYFELTSEWQRFEHFADASGSNNIGFEFGNPAAASGDVIHIYAAQLEQGLVARDYIETTTAAVYGGITDNTPRLDYTDSSCPALLLEPQRTNAFNHSEYSAAIEYNNVNSITNNAAISPEGVQNALEIDADGNDIADSYRNAGSGVVATFSVFAKAGTGDTITLNPSSTGSNATATYDLTNGTISSAGYGQYIDSDIENYGNGWWRCSITFTTGTGAYINRTRFVDTGTYQLYGFQLEAGSYATSYIPTYGSSVSRVGDASSVTGVSDLIGQTEGTLFVEYNSNITEDDSFFIVADDGSANNRIVLYSNTPNKLALVVNNGGSLQVVIPNIPFASGTNKFAVGYANNDVVLYLNGTQVGSDNTCTIPATSALRMGTDHTSAAIASGKGTKQALVFKTRLSNEELAALTTI
jgi:hypothetical protein